MTRFCLKYSLSAGRRQYSNAQMTKGNGIIEAKLLENHSAKPFSNRVGFYVLLIHDKLTFT